MPISSMFSSGWPGGGRTEVSSTAIPATGLTQDTGTAMATTTGRTATVAQRWPASSPPSAPAVLMAARDTANDLARFP